MSATGTYKYIDGKVVKVSDEIPRIGGATSTICTFKRPYWEDNLASEPIYITSRAHKAQLLREQGLTEKDKVRGGWNVPTGE